MCYTCKKNVSSTTKRTHRRAKSQTSSTSHPSPKPRGGAGGGVGNRDHLFTPSTPIHATLLTECALPSPKPAAFIGKPPDLSGQKIFPFPRKSGKTRNSSGNRTSSSKCAIRAKKILLRPQNAHKIATIHATLSADCALPRPIRPTERRPKKDQWPKNFSRGHGQSTRNIARIETYTRARTLAEFPTRLAESWQKAAKRPYFRIPPSVIA